MTIRAKTGTGGRGTPRVPPVGPGAFYSTVQDHGVALAQEPILNFTGALTVVDDAINNRTNVGVSLGALDHNSLANLTVGDVHTQYTYWAGRATGQSITGGTGASEGLTLRSTTNAVKGAIAIGLATLALLSIDEAAKTSTTTLNSVQAHKISEAAGVITDEGSSASGATRILKSTSHATQGTLTLGVSANGTAELLGATINVGPTATTVNVANTSVTTANFGTGATTTNVGKASAAGRIYTSTTITDYISSIANMTQGAGYWTLGAVASAATTGHIRGPAAFEAYSFDGGLNRRLWATTTAGVAWGGASALVYARYDNSTVEMQAASAVQAIFGAGYWTHGPAASASATGSIRMPAAFTMKVLIGGVDRTVLAESGTEIMFGSTAAGMGLVPASAYWTLYAGTANQAQVSTGVWGWYMGSAAVASTGTFRHAKSQSALIRNNGNSQDLLLWGHGLLSTDDICFGSDATGTTNLCFRIDTVNGLATARANGVNMLVCGPAAVSLGTTVATVNVADGTVTTANIGTGATTTNVGKASAAGDIFTATTKTTYINSIAEHTVGAGYVTLGAVASAATAGNIRTAHGFIGEFRNNAGGADIVWLTLGAGTNDQAYFGDPNGAYIRFDQAGLAAHIAGAGTARLSVSNTTYTLAAPTLSIAAAVVTPTWTQLADSTAGVTGDAWTLRAQDVSGTGAAVGGNFVWGAGNGTANNASGGHSVNLFASKTGTGTVGNIAWGALASSWNAGEGITYLGGCTTEPTVSAVATGGAYFWTKNLVASNSVIKARGIANYNGYLTPVVIVPAIINGTMHDWAPVDATTAQLTYNEASTVYASFTNDGDILDGYTYTVGMRLRQVWWNKSTKTPILKDSTGSVAANQFLTPGNVDFYWQPGQGIIWEYDLVAGKGRIGAL